MREEKQDFSKVQFLAGEEVWLVLHERHGFLEGATPQDDCVILTNRRLIGVTRGDGKHRQVVIPLENVDAVEVTDPTRSVKPLATGGLLILGAVAVIWLAAALNLNGLLSWLISGVMVLLGAITASTYIVKEDTAAIVFRTRTTEIGLPLRTPQALKDAYSLTHRFFQARAGHSPAVAQGSHTGEVGAQVPATPSQNTPEPPKEPGTPITDSPTQLQGSAQPEGRQDI